MRSRNGTTNTPSPADKIYTSTHWMNRMIQDLVDSSRLEAGELRMERIPVATASFTIDLLERMSSVLDPERVSMEVTEVVPPALANPDRLERILTNLLSNALKYSQDSVMVRAEEAGGEVRLSGIDHGTWSALLHVLPEADVWVIQLSIEAGRPPVTTWTWGSTRSPA